MRVSKHARGMPTVHAVLQGIRIRPLALRTQLLVAVHAAITRDLGTRHNPISDLDIRDGIASRLDNTAELVAKDIALLQLDDGSVQQVQVVPQTVLPVTFRITSLASTTTGLGTSITLTEFLPIQQRACIVSVGWPYLARSRAGLVMSCSVTALSWWPRYFPTYAAGGGLAFCPSVA